MNEWTFTEALDACPYRTVLAAPNGALEPILGAWAIAEGPALPLPPSVFEDAAEAFRRGGAFLILAAERADRDAAKAALLLRFGATEGRA